MNRFTPSQQMFFNKLKEGQKITGFVKHFRNHGAIIKVGLITGFLRNEDIDYGRIYDPEDKLKQFKKLELLILKINREKQLLFLGLKQLKPDPWIRFLEKYKEGDCVAGNITDVQPYGAFLEIMPGVEGLIHLNQTPGSEKNTNALSLFKIEETYEVKIIMIDPEKRRIGLSLL